MVAHSPLLRHFPRLLSVRRKTGAVLQKCAHLDGAGARRPLAVTRGFTRPAPALPPRRRQTRRQTRRRHTGVRTDPSSVLVSLEKDLEDIPACGLPRRGSRDSRGEGRKGQSSTLTQPRCARAKTQCLFRVSLRLTEGAVRAVSRSFGSAGGAGNTGRGKPGEDPP